VFISFGKTYVSKFSGNECQLFRSRGQTKLQEMLVTKLPIVKNEELLPVTLDFKNSRDAMTKGSF